MKTIGITGGTGLVGKQLAAELVRRGYNVVLLGRRATPAAGLAGYGYAQLDAQRGICDTEAIKSLDAIVALAGESVAGKRWTAAQKEKIKASRVDGTRFLVSQLRAHAPGCTTLVSASAIGYYGPDTDPVRAFTEADKGSNDFLADTCKLWEAEVTKASDFLRTVICRIGIVLSADGGAFTELTKTAKFGILPIPGNGRQIMSWIHIEDLVGLLAQAVEKEQMQGVYNAVAPQPASYDQLAAAISAEKGGLFRFHVPSFVIKMVLGEMSTEVLKSCTVSAEKTVSAGLRFRCPDVASAVKQLMKG